MRRGTRPSDQITKRGQNRPDHIRGTKQAIIKPKQAKRGQNRPREAKTGRLIRGKKAERITREAINWESWDLNREASSWMNVKEELDDCDKDDEEVAESSWMQMRRERKFSESSAKV